MMRVYPCRPGEKKVLWRVPLRWAMMVERIWAMNIVPGPSEMTFPDHFSDHAQDYEAYRPTYPYALFSYLGSLVPARRPRLGLRHRQWAGGPAS